VKQRTAQRGYVLLIVLTIMTVLGGLVTALAGYSAWYYKSTQADRLRQMASAVRDSVTVYVQTHQQAWFDQVGEPAELDIRELLPAGVDGMVTVERADNATYVRYHVHIELTHGRHARSESFELRPSSEFVTTRGPES